MPKFEKNRYFKLKDINLSFNVLGAKLGLKHRHMQFFILVLKTNKKVLSLHLNQFNFSFLGAKLVLNQTCAEQFFYDYLSLKEDTYAIFMKSLYFVEKKVLSLH